MTGRRGSGDHPQDRDELGGRVEALADRLEAVERCTHEIRRAAGLTDARADTEALRVDALLKRAGVAEHRAGELEHRTSDLEDRATLDAVRIGNLEERGVVDRALLLELQADGLVAKEHAENLEKALATSRIIGAAVGIVMARHGLTEAPAFDVLCKLSMDTNRKLRDVADEVVLTGALPV